MIMMNGAKEDKPVRSGWDDLISDDENLFKKKDNFRNLLKSD